MAWSTTQIEGATVRKTEQRHETSSASASSEQASETSASPTITTEQSASTLEQGVERQVGDLGHDVRDEFVEVEFAGLDEILESICAGGECRLESVSHEACFFLDLVGQVVNLRCC